MSLIGPRRLYRRKSPRTTSSRFGAFRSGRVSLAYGKVGPRHHDETTFQQWIEQDLEYIQTWTLRTDFVILAKTARAVVRMTGD